jgi:hypothetical protein
MNFTHMIWAKMSTFVMPKESHEKDRGAGFVEYGALIIFVGVVAALLISSGIADTIVQGIGSAIRVALTRPE